MSGYYNFEQFRTGNKDLPQFFWQHRLESFYNSGLAAKCRHTFQQAIKNRDNFSGDEEKLDFSTGNKESLELFWQ